MRFKYLAAYLPFIPIVLTNENDINKAIQSGDISFGMSNQYKIGFSHSRLRYLLSFYFEHIDAQGHQLLFYPYQDDATYPLTEHRVAQQQQQQQQQQADNAFEKFKDIVTHSYVLKYMQDPNDNSTLENQAKIELFTLILSQWVKDIKITPEYIKATETIRSINKHLIKNLLFPNRKKLSAAKNLLERTTHMNAEAYLQSTAILDIWDALNVIKRNQNNPAFKDMLAAGHWSPAAFLAQQKFGPSMSMRITNKKTDLNGILPCQVSARRLVLLKMRDAATSAANYFSYCCGANFTMNFLTLVIDALLPGVRRLPTKQGCPYSDAIQRPLY